MTSSRVENEGQSEEVVVEDDDSAATQPRAKVEGEMEVKTRR
jgi:hypothetical protein